MHVFQEVAPGQFANNRVSQVLAHDEPFRAITMLSYAQSMKDSMNPVTDRFSASWMPLLHLPIFLSPWLMRRRDLRTTSVTLLGALLFAQTSPAGKKRLPRESLRNHLVLVRLSLRLHMRTFLAEKVTSSKLAPS